MILRALMVAALSLTLIANADAETKGPNGGIVVKAEDHPVEFVFRDQEIVFYVGELAAPLGPKARVVFSSVFDGHNLQARFVTP